MYFRVQEIILTVLAGIAASLAAGAVTQLFRVRRGGGETIELRVRRLTKSLEEATSLISNIESEIEARSSLALQLQNDIDQYNKLVDIKKPEVEAIAQLLRGEIKKEGRTSFWKGVVVNFLFFILGAAASLVITLLLR